MTWSVSDGVFSAYVADYEDALGELRDLVALCGSKTLYVRRHDANDKVIESSPHVYDGERWVAS